MLMLNYEKVMFGLAEENLLVVIDLTKQVETKF